MRNKKRKRKREICMEKRGYESALRALRGSSSRVTNESRALRGQARQGKSSHEGY